MAKFVILVFIGGAMGAMLREFTMLLVPHLANSFPLDILVANLVATVLLGFATALHRRQVVSDGVNLLVATGFCGGLSTFSSFAYGTVVLISASTASAAVTLVYVVISLVLGYLAVIVGLKLGGQGSA